MNLTYHLVPKSYYDSLDSTRAYESRDFAREGFIHCTDGAAEMARTANRYCQAESGAFYYLFIDKARVHAPIRCDDAAKLYPHIHGALNRDAIIAIRAARRDASGIFLEPEEI